MLLDGELVCSNGKATAHELEQFIASLEAEYEVCSWADSKFRAIDPSGWVDDNNPPESRALHPSG